MWKANAVEMKVNIKGKVQGIRLMHLKKNRPVYNFSSILYTNKQKYFKQGTYYISTYFVRLYMHCHCQKHRFLEIIFSLSKYLDSQSLLFPELNSGKKIKKN